VSFFSDLLFEARALAQNLAESVGTPVVRLGVTGLSRAGKTVFITALIQHLTELGKPGDRDGRGALPVFRVMAEGRLTKGRLEPQPDDAVPRFAYEDHRTALTGGADGASRHWPESTRRISEVRLRLDFERAEGFRAGPASLILDIVDYPGEWLLDLPLLGKSYADWSQETLEASASAARASLAADWRAHTIVTDAGGPAEEEDARRAAELFTAYLKSCRAGTFALSTLPPGRFLMPGDLAGSPALTFAPLKLDPAQYYGPETLAGMMERRYEAYKAHVVRPFFRDHFARLDRQIVLVDTLAALNAGPAAVRDLETALVDILQAFRAGRNSVLTAVFKPRIEKILFAATKADHLNHTGHDRLEAILRTIVARAIARADGAGSAIDVIALAGVRATREARIGKGADALDAVVGVPSPGEVIDGEIFDGSGEAAIFPGDLPADPKMALRGEAYHPTGAEEAYRFVRFRPPRAALDDDGRPLPLPHIRLDRALQFLLGDRLA
jgi:predicted YcjX-like family ATPase